MEQNAETLINLIKDIKLAMFTTVCDDGTIHSRPMGTLANSLKNFDGTLWFFSKKNSHKNHELETDQHVNLAYTAADKRFVSVSGRAFISDDKEKMKELWSPVLNTWLPEGLNDPDISLIGVKVESAEIWDAPSSSGANSQHIELQ
jgi:general stress protein 26